MIFAFPQPNSDDSPVAAAVDFVDTPEASGASPADGESVDLRHRPSYGMVINFDDFHCLFFSIGLIFCDRIRWPTIRWPTIWKYLSHH